MRTLVAAAMLVLAAAAAAAPEFETASIRPCEHGWSRNGTPSPGRLTLACMTVADLIAIAIEGTPLSGGPGWITSERYDIDAQAQGNPGMDIMRGPMLLALLEDRFKLKTHRETREVPVYALTVTDDGPKLQPPSGNSRGASLDEFSKLLHSALDRPVIDRTGIAGRFDFHLEFAPDETTPRPLGGGRGGGPRPAGPTIFTAIQEQLGLKLEPADGPVEFVVIDRVEKPAEN